MGLRGPMLRRSTDPISALTGCHAPARGAGRTAHAPGSPTPPLGPLGPQERAGDRRGARRAPPAEPPEALCRLRWRGSRAPARARARPAAPAGSGCAALLLLLLDGKKRRRRSTRHAAGGLLWLAATAVAHQGLFSVLRHHRAARKPRLARAKRTTARRRRPPRRAAPPRASPRLALQQRTRTRTRAPALAPRERSNPPSEFRTGSQKVPARTANRFDHRRWRFCKGTQGQCLI